MHRITLILAFALVVIAAGCSTGDNGNGARTIAQPAVEAKGLAPADKRVDLALPTFSNPTEVDNPFFPVSSQKSVLLLGRVDDQPFRTEVTLLPETRIVAWEGRQVEVLVSQYVAFLGGRLHEVAYDFYAQDDEGAVWYFGEDVFNFENGAIVDTHGTWLAGKDGPAAMIMPADPHVGDVYRPENIPGFVFEEVTVQAVDEERLKVREFHLLDGAYETKTFARGYGEFFTGGGGDVEALALAVPTDSLDEPMPPELTTLANIRGSRAELTAAWKALDRERAPDRIEQRLANAVARLDGRAPRQAAIDVAQSALDLQLRHRPVTEVDRARFDLWLAQLELDAEKGDAASVNGDFFALDYIRDRIQHTYSASELEQLNAELEELGAAVGDEELKEAAALARELRTG